MQFKSEHINNSENNLKLVHSDSLRNDHLSSLTEPEKELIKKMSAIFVKSILNTVKK